MAFKYMTKNKRGDLARWDADLQSTILVGPRRVSIFLDFYRNRINPWSPSAFSSNPSAVAKSFREISSPCMHQW
jgi:hypothetical protein